ncbi:unnamed protein product [Nippostrongylus brasiliensis]|uniref:G_PROTEIN_RECEP_F1_2 domain-containing protein n=1 Tax=Nippostrongylus brasiliensis TaxID=27835 RepID=A0A0N4XCP1_NIPBR|nr:unnamed protein product [Nippostrongylus brasiliensis]
MTAMVNDGNVERMFKRISCNRYKAFLYIVAVRMIVMMGALLPGIGCYFCIAYTYIFQFDVIKNFTQSDQCPEVNSNSFQLYRRAFRNAAPKSACYRRVIYFYTKTMWSELVGLVAVSVLDIKCNFVIHAIAYSLWIISFNFNMLFNTILHHYGGIRETSQKVICLTKMNCTES